MERCVLVVEDEPIIRMDAVAMLEEAGLNVVDFDRGDDALRYAVEHEGEIAAIFTDINLRGEIDGMDLAVAITEAQPNVTVVVTSGRFDAKPERLPPSIQFVNKPWLPLQVLTAMQEAVSQ